MIKGWQQFNEELGPETYRSAGYKLKRMGHGERAKKLFSHSEDMIVRESEKYGVGEVEFQNGVKAQFAGFDFGITWDVYSDNGNINIPLFFKFPDEWDGGSIFCPVELYYEMDSDKLNIIPFDEDAMSQLYGVKFLKFKNRKDAVKIISVLKNLNLKDEMKFDYTEEEFRNFEADFKKVVSKIRVNELYV